MNSLRKMTLVLMGIFLIMNGWYLFAQDMDENRGIDEIIGELEKTQNTGSIQGIDVKKSDPKVLEELGDSVMGELIGDVQRHEWIDRMMGGDGSEQLASIHRSLGIQYIQNDGNLDSLNREFMGPGMMGGWRNSGNYTGSMMGYWSPWSWILGFFLLAAIVIITILFLRKRGPSGSSALGLLNTRYVNGEISREEFQRIKEDLK
ncbi:MAG: SHOCT domain-containing protein [Spirochaetaceae bacterium]|jgi:uncharacterized membrane protein|nr:SHOCT domain-containing protein [Spirochaetaceae bacterium]